MNNKNQEKIIPFKWETDFEFKYRIEDNKIIVSIRKLLYLLDEKNPDYRELLIEINSIKRKYSYIICPEIYKETNNLTKQAIEYYLKGFQLLYDNLINKTTYKKDGTSAAVVKASKMIETGNHFISIIIVKEFENFEEQQAKYLKEKENKK